MLELQCRLLIIEGAAKDAVPSLPSPLTTSPPWQTKPLTMRWNLVPCNQISLEFHASESPECAAANPKY